MNGRGIFLEIRISSIHLIEKKLCKNGNLYNIIIYSIILSKVQTLKKRSDDGSPLLEEILRNVISFKALNSNQPVSQYCHSGV